MASPRSFGGPGRPPTGGPPVPRPIVAELRATARAGQADRAVRAFEHAVGLMERGRDGAAVASAAEVKSLAPRSGAARELLGLALYRAERFREALREFQAYRRITGRLDQNHLIADCQRALGAPDKAIEPAREALGARIPEDARVEAAVVGAAALADLGRFDEALALLRSMPARGRAVRSFDLRLWYVAGDVLERSGRSREAAEEFRRIVRHDAQAFDAAERLATLGG
jgi:tetratricopeptide (TPR) repeat protein